MQLVEDQEAEPASSLDEVPALPRPGEHQLQHHVIRQHDVRRLTENPLAVLVRLLTRIPVEGHRRSALRKPVLKELAQLPELAVRQGVHRVDDDRTDALAAALTQDTMNDRHQIAQALARTRTGGQHVAPPDPSSLDRLTLVPVQREWRPQALFWTALDPEDVAAALVEQAVIDQLVDRAARLEARVERKPRIRPAEAALQLLVDVGADPLVPDLEEPSGKLLVVVDQTITNPEHVQRCLRASVQKATGRRGRWFCQSAATLFERGGAPVSPPIAL